MFKRQIFYSIFVLLLVSFSTSYYQAISEEQIEENYTINNQLDITDLTPIVYLNHSREHIYDYYFEDGYIPPEIITCFPVDLDEVYENSTVENSTGGLTAFFWHNKAYGSAKNYVYINQHNNPNEFIPLRIPCDSFFDTSSPNIVELRNYTTINDELICLDQGLDLIAATDVSVIKIGFGHINLYAGLIEDILDGTKTNFTAGEQIGYVCRDIIPGIDFGISDAKANHHLNLNWAIYPNYGCASTYFYLSSNLKEKLWNYYHTYNCYSMEGVFQANLCGFRNYNLPGTSWGFWYWANETEGYNTNATLALYNMDVFTTNDTYPTIFEDINTGLFRDIIKGYDTGYLSEVGNHLGRAHFCRLEGDELSGIYNRTAYGDFNYGYKTDYQYFRYQVIPGSDTIYGLHDQLIFEAFEDYSAATAGFTEKAYTYIRGIGPKLPPEPEGNPIFSDYGQSFYEDLDLEIEYYTDQDCYLDIQSIDIVPFTSNIAKEFLILNCTISLFNTVFLNNISIGYDLDVLSSKGLDPDKIGMYYHDLINEEWIEVSVKVNTNTQKISLGENIEVNTIDDDHFYIIFGERNSENTPLSLTSTAKSPMLGISAIITSLGIAVYIQRKKD